MKSFKFILLWLLGCSLVILQVTWLRPWSWLNTAVNLSLLLVMITTVRTDWRSGVLLAALLGMLYQLFSPLPFWIHPISFILAAGGAWAVRRRLVTNRTSISLMVSVLGGTAAYYAAAAALMITTKVFDETSLTPVWSVWITAAVWQLAFHPFLAGVWWMVSRQRQAALHVRSWPL